MTNTQIKYIPSKRSLFLTSITDKDIRAVANSALKIPDSLNAIDSKGQFTTANNQRFETAMKILENSIQVERGVEQNFFERLLQGSKLPTNISSALLKKLQAIDPQKSDGAFNYDQFISIINQILSGAEQYTAILELEKQRMGQLQDAYKDIVNAIAGIKDDLNNTSQKRTDKDLTELINSAKEKVRNIYLQRHSLSQSKYIQYFREVLPTMDILLSNAMNDAADTLMASYGEQLLRIIRSSGDYKSLSQAIRDALIASTGKIARRDITKDNINKLNVAENIANDIIEQLNSGSLDTISAPELSKNFGIKNTSANIIKREAKAYEDAQQEYTVQGQKLTDSILKILPLLNSDEQAKRENALLLSILQDKENTVTLQGETKQALDMLTDIRGNLQQLKTIQKKIRELNKNENLTLQQQQELQNAEILLQELKDHIKNQKTAVSKQLAKKIQNLINKQSDPMRDEYVRQLEECFDQGEINISGPELSEVIEKAIMQLVGSNGNIRQFQTGQYNTKADTITINIKPRIPSTTIPLGSLDEDIYQAAINTIPEFYESFQINLKRDTDESFSLKKGASAWYTAIKKASESLGEKINNSQKQNNKNDSTEVILQKIAEELKNSIVVTTTVKTFNQYNNDIGFLSGSLGANLTAQIDNFSTLFEATGAGGFTQQEAQTLEVLLVNCSSAAMGAANKDPLEKMLSILAAFAVFDEGSAEVEMIAQTAQNSYAQSSPHIMHLYRLNALYFPGSYVLQSIKDHLTQTLQVTSSNITRTVNNDGAVIRAVADEKLVPKEGTPEEKWTQAFSAALSKEYTSVSVAFMSGLLDIVNQLSEAMNP